MLREWQMDCPCNQLFSSTGLTKDQNWKIACGDTRHTIEKGAHGLAAPNQIRMMRAQLGSEPNNFIAQHANLGEPFDVQLHVHARLKRIILYQSYLVRWSALGYLDCSATPSGRELRLRMQWLGTLASDSAPLVADEGRHRIAELELEVSGRKAKWWPNAEWQAKRGALEKAEPMTFSTLEIRFLTQVARGETADYMLDELDAFARSLETVASERGTCR